MARNKQRCCFTAKAATSFLKTKKLQSCKTNEQTVESLHLQGLQNTAKSQFRWVPSYFALLN